jgi:hypothetical protein
VIEKIVAIDIYWTWPLLVISGIFCLLVAFKVIKATPKPPLTEEEYEKKYRSKLKWIGPMLIVFGMLKAFRII